MNKGNQLSEDGQKPAESVERRGLAEGNTRRASTAETQGLGKVSRGLSGVREAARRDKRLQFTALLHHIDVPLLRESYERLKRGAAPGVDGVRWEDYQEGLLDRLTDLHDRVHKGSYRALPSKRARIAKEDGSERKLGIAALEDKIVQQAVATVLMAIYAVPYNLNALNQFRYEVGRTWLRALRRRSQKARRNLSWEKFKLILGQWLPMLRIAHPWPNVRFRRRHPRQEPCAVIPHARISTGGAS